MKPRYTERKTHCKPKNPGETPLCGRRVPLEVPTLSVGRESGTGMLREPRHAALPPASLHLGGTGPDGPINHTRRIASNSYGLAQPSRATQAIKHSLRPVPAPGLEDARGTASHQRSTPCRYWETLQKGAFWPCTGDSQHQCRGRGDQRGAPTTPQPGASTANIPRAIYPGAQQPSGTAHVPLLGSDDSAGLVHVAAAAPAVYGYSQVNN